jgi:hypothetical protein
MTEIQRHIIKRSKRNVVSRFFRSKGDEKAIAAWRSNLDKIHRVFEVRPTTSTRWLLICRLQAELKANTDAKVPDVRPDPPKPRATISKPRRTSSNTSVPEMRHDTLTNRPAVSGTDQRLAYSNLIVPKVQGDHVDGRPIASNSRHSTSESKSDMYGQNRMVIYHSYLACR